MFNLRIKEAFPAGMQEKELIERFVDDGFKLQPGSNEWPSASLKRGLVIQTLWSVRWRAEGGSVHETWGVYGAIAP
ncbi:MAG: hypothetical protein AAGK17_03885 [Pseudomonadota bacterium]